MATDISHIFEVVSGQIRLSKQREFMALHNGELLPMMRAVGIEPYLLLLTDLGRYCRFLDIYRYKDLAEYAAKTTSLLNAPGMESYYQRVGDCIEGGLTIEIMRRLPYAASWEKNQE